MKNMKVIIVILILKFVININTLYSQSLQLNTITSIVVKDLNEVYGKDENWQNIVVDDLNRRFEIFDILTLQSVGESIGDNRIYYFSLLGDDQVGSYLLVENNFPKIIQNHDLTDLKETLDFMCRNGYSEEQISKSLKFIINRYVIDTAFTVH